MTWKDLMHIEKQKLYFQSLIEFVRIEYAEHQVFPAENQIFKAFEMCPYHAVRVVILGQDPYHNEHQAHGLAFSVPNHVAKPPSLNNILKELSTDIGLAYPKNSDLTPWATQGVLLLNTVLTVRKNEPGSHRQKGWEHFTDAAISYLNQRATPMVFVLWGNDAKKKQSLINREHHLVITAPHPSPLSAYRGFLGSQPFSTINAFLQKHHREGINWSLDDNLNI